MHCYSTNKRFTKHLTLIVTLTLLLSFHFSLRATELNLDNYKGKVVYLDFWASWCEPCHRSFPIMNQFQKKYGKENFAVIAVNLDSESQEAHSFLAEHPINFEVIYDPKGGLAETYQVEEMPSVYIFNKKGELKHTHSGFRKKDIAQLESYIQTLLNE